jgi:putative ABC transport system permease protein
MVDVHTGDVPSLVAVGRAAVQLVVVALVIGWIFTHPVALVPYLTVTLVGPAFARYRPTAAR